MEVGIFLNLEMDGMQKGFPCTKAICEKHLKARNQIVSSLHDEIFQPCERKIKVVSQKYNKNKLIILRTIVFKLYFKCSISNVVAK